MCYNVNLEIIILSEIGWLPKNHILYDSTYMKYSADTPIEKNPERLMVARVLEGKEKGEGMLMGIGFLWGRKYTNVAWW